MKDYPELVIDSIELQTRPVKIAGEPYTLTELDGLQRDKHLGEVSKRMQYIDGKAVGFQDYTDYQANLIAMSLKDKEGKPVPVAVIRKWSSRVQEQLAMAVQTLSGLDKGRPAAIEEAKND